MDTLHGLIIAALIVGVQIVVWGSIFYRLHRQTEAIRTETWRSGEMIVFGPVRANYQGWNGRFGVTKTIGALVLLDRRLLFKRPIGRDISIPLSDIGSVSDTVTLGSMKHTSGSYVSLTLRDDSSVVFILRDAASWRQALQTALVST